MRFIKEHLVVFFAGAFTIVMLTFGFLYGSLHYSEDNGIAEMGAFIAGIFAPVIWVWFLASYKVQSSELKLQREELKLQRQALEKQVEELGLNREELSLQREELGLQRKAIQQSTLAQQGSEQALKEQSKATQNQLILAQKQFRIYQEEREEKKPKYRLNQFNEVQFLNPSNGDTPFYFQCKFPILNVGAPSKITLLEISHPLQGMDMTGMSGNKISTYWIYINEVVEGELEITSNFRINDYDRLASGEFDNDQYKVTEADCLYSPEKRLAKEICREYLVDCKLTIHYSSDLGVSGADEYEFIREGDTFKMLKVYRQIIGAQGIPAPL